MVSGQPMGQGGEKVVREQGCDLPVSAPVSHARARPTISRRSFWTLTGSPSLLSHPSFLSIAKANRLTPEQTLFKLAQAQGITPLSGTTNAEHMRQDVEVEKADLKVNGVEEEVKAVKSLIG